MEINRMTIYINLLKKLNLEEFRRVIKDCKYIGITA